MSISPLSHAIQGYVAGGGGGAGRAVNTAVQVNAQEGAWDVGGISAGRDAADHKLRCVPLTANPKFDPYIGPLTQAERDDLNQWRADFGYRYALSEDAELALQDKFDELCTPNPEPRMADAKNGNVENTASRTECGRKPGIDPDTGQSEPWPPCSPRCVFAMKAIWSELERDKQFHRANELSDKLGSLETERDLARAEAQEALVENARLRRQLEKLQGKR